MFKYAKKGLTPSQIGVVLRDSFGIPQVKAVTGSKILRILKVAGLAPELPEDLYHLIKKVSARDRFSAHTTGTESAELQEPRSHIPSLCVLVVFRPSTSAAIWRRTERTLTRSSVSSWSSRASTVWLVTTRYDTRERRDDEAAAADGQQTDG